MAKIIKEGEVRTESKQTMTEQVLRNLDGATARVHSGLLHSQGTIEGTVTLHYKQYNGLELRVGTQYNDSKLWKRFTEGISKVEGVTYNTRDIFHKLAEEFFIREHVVVGMIYQHSVKSIETEMNDKDLVWKVVLKDKNGGSTVIILDKPV